ncbi:YcjF family protein [Algibacillus agarilyticus]|uniref:YcjF family protein n=1 Tax=Algibacillus agarilyticus TaxID=2234133 RepID=UPI000DCFAD94|nr:YcjF family protein [Algibacillus agarilyticus]
MNAVVEEIKDDESEHETSESQIEQANKVVRNYAIGSVIPSLIPVPAVDLVAVTGIQLKMLHSLAAIYDVPFKEELVRSSISSVIGGTVALSVSRVASSAIKAIPGVGTMIGSLAMPTVSGATTYGLGRVFIQHFESGGTFLTFDADKVRDYFEQEFKKGKAVVAEANESGEIDQAVADAKATHQSTDGKSKSTGTTTTK